MLYNFSWVIPQKLAGCNMPGRCVVLGNHIPMHPINISKDLIQLKEEYGIDVIASVVESLPKGFDDCCKSLDITQLYYPIDDYNVPQDIVLFRQFVNVIIQKMKEGNKLCVHCKAGVGRTGLTLACVMGTYLRLDAMNAISELRKIRPSIENDKQMQFVLDFLGK